MAYAVVEGSAYTNTASGTSHSVLLPSTVNAGELLLIFSSSDGVTENISTAASGWTRIAYTSYSGHCSAVFKKTANGTEGGTSITITTASTEATAHIAIRVSGWASVQISSVASGASTGPNPPSITPSWGSADNLYIAAAGGDYNRTVSTYPLASNNLFQRYNTTGGCWVAICSENSTSSPRDPGAFLISASDDWTAYTLAIQPATVVDLVPAEGSQGQSGDGATLGLVFALSPAEGVQPQVGDSADLAQVHALVPAEGTQGQAGDGAALAQVHALVPAEGLQAQAGDNAILEVAVALVPAEGSQGQVGDTASLTQVHQLAAQKGSQSQSGDGAALTQAHQIVAQEGTQGQTGDGAVVEVLPVGLVPAEGSQAQAGDSAVLTQTHVLGAQEGTQGQTGDQATLEVGIVALVPQEGTQGQAGDTPSLAQVHVLAPAEGVQSQAGDQATLEIPATDLISQEGSQGQAGDSTDLTQVHALAPDEGAQAQAGDEATLGFDLPIDLAAGGGSQGQAGDGTALTQEHNLLLEGQAQILLNPDFELWSSPTDCASWLESISGSSTINRELAVVFSGQSSARLDVDAANSLVQLYQGLSLLPDTWYRASFWYKTDAGKKASAFVRVTIGGSYYYLQPDGVNWLAPPNYDYTDQLESTVWANHSFAFKTPASAFSGPLWGAYGGLDIPSASSSIYLDKAFVTVEAEAHQEQGGDGASLIVGLLTTYEFVDRLLLEERIAKARIRREIEATAVANRVCRIRVRPLIERVGIHSRSRGVLLRRSQ